MVLLDNGGGPAREGLDIHPPPADLRRIVRHTWIERADGTSRPWRVVPDAAAHMIAAVRRRGTAPEFRLVFVGPRSKAADIDVSGRELSVGVRLRPGALHATTGIYASDLLDRVAPLADVLSARALHDLRLTPDASPDQLEHALLMLLRRLVHAASDPVPMDVPPLCTRVRDLAQMLETPARSLYEQFRRDVGLPPKLLLRVTRLHRALWASRAPHPRWAAIAQDCGYADQAHLSREFAALLGETPTRWLARGAADSFKTSDRQVL